MITMPIKITKDGFRCWYLRTGRRLPEFWFYSSREERQGQIRAAAAELLKDHSDAGPGELAELLLGGDKNAKFLDYRWESIRKIIATRERC